MVTWPPVCYDVILKVNLLLNLVMNCTLIVMAENLKRRKKAADIDRVSKAAMLFFLLSSSSVWFVSIFFKGKP